MSHCTEFAKKGASKKPSGWNSATPVGREKYKPGMLRDTDLGGLGEIGLVFQIQLDEKNDPMRLF